MPPYAVRVRTSTGWQDIALVGPAGAKGDPGPTGPTGAAATVNASAYNQGAYSTFITPVATTWTTLPIGLGGGETIDPAGSFVRNADGSVTAVAAGWYEINASAQGNAVSTSVQVSIGTAANVLGMYALDGDSGSAAFPRASTSCVVLLTAGQKVFATGWCSTTAQIGLTAFSIARVGGPKGDPGPWRGAWAAGTAYAVGDAVSYASGGVTATYRRTVSGTTVGAPSSDTTNWELIASGGSIGAAGGQAVTFLVGDGSATSFTCIHNFVTRNVTVSVFRSASPYDEIEADVERTDVNTVTVRSFPTVPAVGEYTVVVSAPGQQATLNITMDGWHTVGAAGEPGFLNSWLAYGGPGYTTPGFRKFPDGRVRLKGGLRSGVLAQPAFVLPVGYRPAQPHRIIVYGQTTGPTVPCLLYIDTSGNVYPYTGTNTEFDIDGVEFDTESVLQTASVAAQPLDAWHLIGAPGEPTFGTAGLVHYGGTTAPSGTGWQNVGFRKDVNGRVFLKGLLGVTSSVTPGGSTIIFMLPAGFRPPQQVITNPQRNSAAAMRVDFAPDGRVMLNFGATMAVGDYVPLDGLSFDTESVSAYTTGVLGPPRVTALPTSPIDGQECYLVADAASGVIWRLRYNAASASAYKWEFIGGSALTAFYATSDTMVSGWSVYTNPVVTLPVAGDYVVSISGNVSIPAGMQVAIGVGYGGSQIPDTETVLTGHPAGLQSLSRSELLVTGLAAGALRGAAYAATTGATFARRSLSARPMRVG
jgi:hypothetical protein